MQVPCFFSLHCTIVLERFVRLWLSVTQTWTLLPVAQVLINCFRSLHRLVKNKLKNTLVHSAYAVVTHHVFSSKTPVRRSDVCSQGRSFQCGRQAAKKFTSTKVQNLLFSGAILP